MGHIEGHSQLFRENDVLGPRKLMKIFNKVKANTGDVCANVEKLCAVAAVVPVSTAEVERVFSDLSRTKTDIRNRLDVETIHQLLMIHRNDQYLDFTRAVKRWHGKKPKRRI